MSEFISSDYDCYVINDGDRLQPLCAIYSKKLLPLIEKLEIVKPIVFAVSGYKNSGKTFMIEKLINEFVEKNMEYRIAQENEYRQIAEMKWLHCEEDDADYSTNILLGADRSKFIEEFVDFLNEHREYKLFVAIDNGIVVSSMFVYIIPKTPKPNRNQKYIAYLTNVYSLKEYRNKNIGTELLTHIKDHLSKENCELMFVWPSKKSVNWYIRNGFESNNEIFECSI